ncbi:MAG: hypothetical protein ACLFV3_09275 [Phycisphaeraceae bacterium]
MQDSKTSSLTTQNPVDQIVTHAIEKISNKGRGWVLGLASEVGEDGGTSIEVRESLPPIDEHIPLADLRRHRVDNTESFVAYAQKYGDAEKSLIFYNDAGATLILDESIERGQRETASLEFERSDEWDAWGGVIGDSLGHRRLLNFLTLYSHTLDTPEILASMASAKANVTVDIDSSLKEDQKTVGYLVKSSAGSELQQFPKELRISVPVLDVDVEDPEAWAQLTLRLHIDLPAEPGGKVTFSLLCPGWDAVLRGRTRREADKLRAGLEGFTILRGRMETERRRVGRQAT